MEQPRKFEETDLVQVANDLEVLNNKENDGRGVSCVSSVITYLRLGKVGEARSVASTDHDKIRNYPDIENFLKERLFNGEELYRWMPDK